MSTFDGYSFDTTIGALHHNPSITYNADDASTQDHMSKAQQLGARRLHDGNFVELCFEQRTLEQHHLENLFSLSVGELNW